MPQDADAGGVVLTPHFKADAHGHNYAEIGFTQVNPTCNQRLRQVYMPICGEIIEKELPPSATTGMVGCAAVTISPTIAAARDAARLN